MLWLGPRDMLPQPPRDDKKYWDKGVVVSEPEMMTGSWQVLVKSQRKGQSPISPERVFILKQQDVTEMDSQPPQGRIKSDGTRSHSTYGSRDGHNITGPESTGKTTTPKKVIKKGTDILDRAFKDADKENVKEAGFEPHTAKFGKQVLGHGKDWDEPAGHNNIEIKINDRTWKIIRGAGPEGSQEWFNQRQKMKDMCARKSAETGKDWRMYITGKPTTESVAEGQLDEIKQRLDPKCWKGKHKEGTKIKGGVRVNNCVPNESVEQDPNDPQWSKKYSKNVGESTTKIPTGLKHHGDYGSKYPPEEYRDEYGHKVRGQKYVPGHEENEYDHRGRPPKASMATVELPADAFGRVSGKVPKGKQGIRISGKSNTDESTDYASAVNNLLNEFAGGMGAGGVASAPGIMTNPAKTGSLFGGSYSQKNSPFKKKATKKESVIKR